MDNNYNNFNNHNNVGNSNNEGGYSSYNPYSQPQQNFSQAQQNFSQSQQGFSQDSNSQYGGSQYGSSQYGNSQNAGYQTTSASTQKKGAFAGFGVTLVKTVTIALVFGLVAGATGSAVLKLNGVVIEENQNKLESNGQADTQEEDTNKKNNSGTLQQTNTDVNTTVAIMDVSDIAENVMPSVVAISNKAEITYQSFWGQTYTQESESAGTGVIVSQDKHYIYIATNNHVVASADELTVQFSDGSIVTAEIKGTVASKDLAVVKVKLTDISNDTLGVIRVASLGDSNELEVGEAAIAIGNALGYGQSVTTGVISATGRSVTVSDPSTGGYVVNNNLIQTDAAINPGNSGGALLNVKGEVIGINSVKYADTSVEGIGYAIPINDAMLIIDKLINGQKIDESQSGYLGIQGKDSELGAYVHSVFPGSAAQKAGIEAGDIIIEFEGTEIATMSQLKELLSYHPAGDTVSFVILRPIGDGEYTKVGIDVILGDSSTIQQ